MIVIEPTSLSSGGTFRATSRVASLGFGGGANDTSPISVYPVPGFVMVTVFTTPKTGSYVPVASAKTPGTSETGIHGLINYRSCSSS